MLQVQTHLRAVPLQSRASLGRAADAKPHASPRPFETIIIVKQGERLFDEGEPAAYFYKLARGSVRLVKMVGDGYRQICAFHLAGDLIGFSNTPKHAFAAEAIEDCTLVRYRRRDAEALIKADPGFACELQTLTANGLNDAYTHMARLGHRSARDRLAWFLLSMTDRSTSRDGWIDLPMNRVDIADHLGLAHETVSRAFTQLKKTGVIVEPALNRIRVLNRAALEGELEAPGL